LLSETATAYFAGGFTYAMSFLLQFGVLVPPIRVGLNLSLILLESCESISQWSGLSIPATAQSAGFTRFHIARRGRILPAQLSKPSAQYYWAEGLDTREYINTLCNATTREFLLDIDKSPLVA